MWPKSNMVKVAKFRRISYPILGLELKVYKMSFDVMSIPSESWLIAFADGLPKLDLHLKSTLGGTKGFCWITAFADERSENRISHSGSNHLASSICDRIYVVSLSTLKIHTLHNCEHLFDRVCLTEKRENPPCQISATPSFSILNRPATIRNRFNRRKSLNFRRFCLI